MCNFCRSLIHDGCAIVGSGPRFHPVFLSILTDVSSSLLAGFKNPLLPENNQDTDEAIVIADAAVRKAINGIKRYLTMAVFNVSALS